MNAIRDAAEIFTNNYGSVYRTEYGIAVRISSTDRDELERFAATVNVGCVRETYGGSWHEIPCRCTFGEALKGTGCRYFDVYEYVVYNLDAVIQIASRLWKWLPEKQRFRFEFAIDECVRARLQRYRGRETVRAIRARAASEAWNRTRYESAAYGERLAA